MSRIAGWLNGIRGKLLRLSRLDLLRERATRGAGGRC